MNTGGAYENFVSQCIYAGAGVMNFTPDTGWYYISLSQRSPSWTGVEFLYDFLVNNQYREEITPIFMYNILYELY